MIRHKITENYRLFLQYNKSPNYYFRWTELLYNRSTIHVGVKRYLVK